MTSLALRNLGARKLRSFLTALAILLGVMMVAGTYVLTDQTGTDRVVRVVFEDGTSEEMHLRALASKSLIG